jgi:predicted transcriptional regulator
MCAQTATQPVTASERFSERFHIRLDEEMRRALDALAAANERTLTGEIRLAIREHIRRARDDA